MAIQYTNRQGDVYYLHEGKSKTGKSQHYFSKSSDGILANVIPEGFEIYESPEARVFLRRIPPRIVTDDEIAIVKDGVQQYANLKFFIVDVKKNAIEVFLPDQGLDLAEEFCRQLGPLAFGRETAIKDFLIDHAHYSPMMRFVLRDEKNRTFAVERWCFRGWVDGWIQLETSENLSFLVKKYGVHLGKESFFDLMP